MNTFNTLTVNGQTYQVDARIHDDTVSPDTTWSSEKLNGQFGDVNSALDAIIAIQNSLMGGDGA